ncbi:MAG: hypothetical protein AAGF84_11680 [Planctomycetota bacterium]
MPTRGRRVTAWLGASLVLWACSTLAGCGFGPRTINPAFDTRTEQAEAILDELAADPWRPDRPILLVGGYFDPTGAEIAGMRKHLEAHFGTASIHTVRYFALSEYDRLAAQLVQETDEAFGPGINPDRTVAVDVVALSMGGLVARHAALVGDGQRTLDLRRLFTVGTPHRGSIMDTRYTPDELLRDMQPGSDFLTRLQDAYPEATYTIVSYVRLGDGIVGQANAAPPGQTAIWLDSLPWQRPHADALHDPRIQADILLRLRGLVPLARDPLPQ